MSSRKLFTHLKLTRPEVLGFFLQNIVIILNNCVKINNLEIPLTMTWPDGVGFLVLFPVISISIDKVFTPQRTFWRIWKLLVLR